MNYIYGTWSVLCALNAAGVDHHDPVIRKAADWLVRIQNADGGWGGWPTSPKAPRSGVEETALAVEALAAAADSDERHASAWHAGLSWLTEAVERNSHRECSPIGFYFAKLWYYERLYPQIFTVAALGQAV